MNSLPFGWMRIGLAVWGSGLAFSVAEIPQLDPTAEGPWSDIVRTTLGVPQVENGRIAMDGKVSQGEYGNFPGQVVDPGENAWILDFPGDRQWDDAADSSFTFFLAHDETSFYVGVQVADDVLNQDDDEALWKDDSVEIIVDALNDRYDVNTDSSNDAYGGHNYVSHNAKFSSWNHAENVVSNERWSSGVEWTYGEEGEVWAVGNAVEGGWHLDVRFAKSLFEDPEAGNRLKDNYTMGFNIGLDDDDKFGPGTNGDGSREQDLELQYWWANRARLFGWTAEAAANYSEQQIANGEHEADFEKGINSGGRLTHGGTGEVIFESFNRYEEPGPTIDVGDLDVGEASPGLNTTFFEVITVWNRGIENPLTITDIVLGGPSAGNFSVEAALPLTIGPGESADIDLAFYSGCDTGALNATLEFISDDAKPERRSRTIALTGAFVNLLGPVAHFSLDEPSGAAEMLDISGHGNHGLYEAGAGSLALGEAALATGTALQVSGGALAQADGGSLGLESFTISTWMQADGGEGFQTVLAQGEPGSGPTYALLASGGNLTWFVGEAPVFGTEDGSAYADGTPHHVAVTYQHADPNRVAIYVDGVEVASQEGLGPLVIERSTAFMVGSFGGALPFSGRLDDVQIYDRALSSEDVAWLTAHPGEVIGRIDPEACGEDGGGGNGGENPSAELLGVRLEDNGVLTFALPQGLTAEVEHSIDLDQWEVIASDVQGVFAEGDAGRLATPRGFYRVRWVPSGQAGPGIDGIDGPHDDPGLPQGGEPDGQGFVIE